MLLLTFFVYAFILACQISKIINFKKKMIGKPNYHNSLRVKLITTHFIRICRIFRGLTYQYVSLEFLMPHQGIIGC